MTSKGPTPSIFVKSIERTRNSSQHGFQHELMVHIPHVIGPMEDGEA